MENNWIGGIGDRRVISVDTRKIFSCPEAVAYSINFNDPNQKEVSIKEEDIIVNCNRYSKTIFNGLKFEWYNQFLLDNNLKDFSSPAEFVKIVIPESNRTRAINSGQGPKKYYDDVRKIYRAIKKTYLINPAIIGISFTIPRFLEVIGIEKKSSAAFSKHFRIYEEEYINLFKAEFSTQFSKKAKREILSIKLNEFKNIGTNPDVDADWDIIRYFSRHDDAESAYLKGKRNVSHPVIRIEDQRIFGSISTAARMTSIEKQKIVWCCEGDIPYCKKWASRFTFRYVKFIQEIK
jgi:hypothetical protein